MRSKAYYLKKIARIVQGMNYPNMKTYSLIRYSSQNRDTLGILFSPDCNFMCYTLEDEYRTQKVYGETRIPAGIYKLGLRKEGGWHNTYLNKFGEDFHKGMICIHNFPNWRIVTDTMEFQYCLFHAGNDEGDTSGCILTGNTVHQNVTQAGFIGNSVKAYKRIYPEIAEDILNGYDVRLEIFDNAL